MSSDLLPEGEAMRQAVHWIVEERKSDGTVPLAKLLDRATLKFDLSPRQSQLLITFYQRAIEAENQTS